jgi:GNAT superfamily N-acetyltransferase
MTSPEDLHPAAAPGGDVRVERVRHCPAHFYRFLYSEVGRTYHWVDRLGWSDTQIRAHLGAPGVSVWALYVEGAPGGYFELARQDEGAVEIAYFGLLPELIGRGLGRYLLTVAVERAWSEGARRVWLHTCTLDDPAALPNYLRRGFRPYKTEIYSIDKNQ